VGDAVADVMRRAGVWESVHSVWVAHSAPATGANSTEPAAGTASPLRIVVTPEPPARFATGTLTLGCLHLREDSDGASALLAATPPSHVPLSDLGGTRTHDRRVCIITAHAAPNPTSARAGRLGRYARSGTP
jgi:hypothetical protein